MRRGVLREDRGIRGSGGSRPGFGGRMPKLPTLLSKQDFKVRAKEEVDTYRAVAGKQYKNFKFIKIEVYKELKFRLR